MAYIINKSNGSKLVTIEDGSINVSVCDLTLVGKNYAGYGESIATNFVKLLENFSSPKQPAKPLTGQLWYDSANKKVKVYTGADFKPIPSLQSSKDYPTDQLKGDLHYNETEGKLYYFDGQGYVLIGPQLSGKAAINTVAPALLLGGNDDLQRYVLTHQIQNFYDETEVVKVAVLSNDKFSPASEDYAVRFPVIKQGITLSSADPSTGVSASSPNDGYIFWGTAADSLRLAGRSESEYVRYENPLFTSQVRVNTTDGINIASNGLRLFTNAVGAQLNTDLPRISFNATDGGELFNIINVEASDNLALMPSRTAGNLVNIGSESNPFNNVYGNRFVGTLQGTASASDAVNLVPTNTENGMFYITFVNSATGSTEVRTDPGIHYNPSINTLTVNTVATNRLFKSGANGSGDIGQTDNRYNNVYANSTTAVYADLAEKYLADADYEPGTVLRIGGEKEVTICASYEHEGIAGIVSTAPAYLMNDMLEGGVAIALKGRVPCKVKGPVKKGDILVSSSTPGHAEVRKYGHRTNPLAILGKALQDFDGDVGVIEVMVW